STCTLGAEAADFTVAVVGSSHSVNWLPAIDVLGRKNGWRVISITKSACGFHSAGPQACLEWHENVAAYMKKNTPDLVIIGESMDRKNSNERLKSMSARLERITRTGVAVIGISPMPKLDTPPADCLPDRIDKCRMPRELALRLNAF